MMQNWRPVSKEREMEWFHLVSGMLDGMIFEYFPDRDTMLCTRYVNNGYQSEKEIKDYFSFFAEFVHPDDLGEMRLIQEQIRKKKERIYGELRICFDIRFPDCYQMGALQGRSFFDEQGNVSKVTGQMYRLGEQWKEKQKLSNEAKKDSMTKLWNHKYTQELIREYMDHDGEKGSFFIIDVDNFKRLNDAMGHHFGDQVILSVARVLQNLFRSSDIVGKMGGDEFVVFMKDEVSLPLIQLKCNEICSAVSKIYCGEKDYKVSACVGVACYPGDGYTYEELLEKADSALYYVKSVGKNNFAVYNSEIAQMVECGRKTERKLESAGEVRQRDKYDDFYNEITELTFRLIGDTTDVDSAIHLLLHKLKEHFGFDIVCIQEVYKEEARTMRYMYEVKPEGAPERLHTFQKYTDSEWMLLLYTMEKGRYLYDTGIEPGMDLPLGNGKNGSALRIPLGNKNFFTGVVDFVFLDQEHVWEEKEIKFLESFSKILSVYLTRIRTFDEAHFLATIMQERDSVTGLYSYEKFLERMKEITAAMSEDIGILYIYCDICHFKYINETYGYEVGDLVLRKFAEFLTGWGGRDMLCTARVHSDNIIMAMKNSHNLTIDELARLMEDQHEQAAQVLRQYVHDNMIAVRSGIFLNNDKELSVEEAVSNVAYACKESKRYSNSRCVVFTEELMEDYKRQLRFLNDLQGAIEKKEIMVYIQPKMMADGVTVAGGEALVRWLKAGKEMIYPDDFIPVFEKSGAIVEVDYYVYREVFSYLRKRMDAGLKVVPISMNVSRVHLDNGKMVEYIKELMVEYRMEPQLVEFELTESIYVENLDKAITLISWLRSQGIKVSMDDFGSGYSSLNMLSKMPVDIMKIDRIFLKNASVLESDRIILESVVDMAKRLQVCVVCEGVETAEQFEFLQSIGCDVMQGYYFGKPMKVKEFDEFLQRASARREAGYESRNGL